MQKIYIVDDDDAMRDSLTWLLEGEDHAVECFASAEAFLEALTDDMSGCLILDVRMPDMSGLELHERLAAMGNHLPIIFITGHGDVPMAVSALQRGACDFMQKPFSNEDLLARIQRVLTLDCQQSAQRQRDASLLQRAAHLSAREVEVMQRVVEGKLNKQIADELNISMKTVEAHRARAMEKIGARTLAELVKISLALEKLNFQAPRATS
jgi:FixJ family two-component response regulator